MFSVCELLGSLIFKVELLEWEFESVYYLMYVTGMRPQSILLGFEFYISILFSF